MGSGVGCPLFQYVRVIIPEVFVVECSSHLHGFPRYEKHVWVT